MCENVVYGIATSPLTISKVVEILTNPEREKVFCLPPVKPKGQKIFLFSPTTPSQRGSYKLQSVAIMKKLHGIIVVIILLIIIITFTFVEDWRCDQYRWFNNAVKKILSKHSIVKKTYFICDTADGPCSDFKKHSYELLSPHGFTLIHYIGDERVASDFSHGNRKSCRKFVQICPLVIRTLDIQCSNSTTSHVYRHSITDTTKSIPSTHIPVLTSRNSQQVENVRKKNQ